MMFTDLVQFLKNHGSDLFQKTLEHITLVSLSLLIAAVFAIFLGILITRFASLRNVILKAGSVSQTIPSLAMLAFLVPFLGLGNVPTLVVLTFYAIYPILRSTYAGLMNVPSECIEAAEGLGFSNFQKLWFVELPLALPTIISGLRIATAMTIGIATIAAFIGAGGLGDFITQGLALNSSPLILLGAIPIAILALGFDYGISQLEARLHHRKIRMVKFSALKKILLITTSLMIIFLGARSFYNENLRSHPDSIVIASKNFTEQFILAELMAQLIEDKTSLKVIRKFNMGTTDIVHSAMINGNVDLYPEYSGTAYLTVLKEPQNEGNIFEKVKAAYKEKFNILWLNPFGFSNSQSLAIKKEFAHNHQIKAISDLKPFSKELTIAAPPEFLKRADAFPGLNKAYQLQFKEIIQVDPNLMYLAIDHQDVDVIAAFTTDGKLQKYGLITLQDDKEFYPPYHAAPLIREAVFNAHPEIQKALESILGFISEEKMAALNYKVDVEGFSPAEAIRQFLHEFKSL